MPAYFHSGLNISAPVMREPDYHYDMLGRRVPGPAPFYVDTDGVAYPAGQQPVRPQEPQTDFHVDARGCVYGVRPGARVTSWPTNPQAVPHDPGEYQLKLPLEDDAEEFLPEADIKPRPKGHYFVGLHDPQPAPSGTVAGSILREAAGIVEGSRNATHGDKERSFRCIADFWAVYDRYSGNVEATPREVSDKMVLLKLARALCGTPVRDHFVDMAGYAGVSGELEG